MTQEPAEVPDVLYVPVAGDEDFASVWAIDPALTYISNITEANGQRLAEEYPERIYFFAELIMGDRGVEIYDAMFAERMSVGDGEPES